MALKLIHQYHKDDVIKWFSGDFSYSSLKESDLDDRDLCIFFFKNLMSIDYGSPRQRLPNGIEKVDYEKIVKLLASLPFKTAINTWLDTSYEWLQICNIDQFLAYRIKIKKPVQPHENIPQLMIGVSEYSFL